LSVLLLPSNTTILTEVKVYSQSVYTRQVPATSAASLVTQNKIHTIRLKDEIKFLHIKKAKLNEKLYNIHLKAAQEWGNSWYILLDHINCLVCID
jgi:hypothetical protein